MFNKTSSIHALVFTGLILGVSGSQASEYVGSGYRQHHQDRQYNNHRSRHHERQEYRQQHNRYRYYGHSPYFNYRPQPYAYRHYNYRRSYPHAYRHGGYSGYGSYYQHGGLFLRLY